MLAKLVNFENKVTLIAGSGVQFLDFGLSRVCSRPCRGEFGDIPGQTAVFVST